LANSDVLVFLPGVTEINRVAKHLQARLDDTTELHTLHSGVSTAAQVQATAAATESCRRIILSTSLAETSVTIDGVRVVIDSGLERRGSIDATSGAQRLETVMASQASATQRAGRAGRTTSGVCYRLWSESGHSRRPAHWQPEIYRADLAPLLLEIYLWGASCASELTWLDPPPPASIARADALLQSLGLVKQQQLTKSGRAVAALPVHPRLGHMLAWAVHHGVQATACRLAVLLEEQRRSTESADAELPSAAVILAQAFPDWIAQRRTGEPGKFRLSCGVGVQLFQEDSLAHCQWLVVAQLGGASRELRVFKAMQLNIDELLRFSPELFSQTNHLDWDDKQQRVLGEVRQQIGHLVVDARPMQNIDNTHKATALIVGIRRLGLTCLPWNDECREWQARVIRMHALTTNTSINEWPAVDDNAMLDYRQQVLLDEWLPKRYRVPSGSFISLSYLRAGNPVLSVRLQEMLGCADNPSIANGQIKLKVELLSPARRPVQVTTDLANFWSNSYPAVKKEMAGRYPKHVWPDDPLSAQPTTRTKRR